MFNGVSQCRPRFRGRPLHRRVVSLAESAAIPSAVRCSRRLALWGLLALLACSAPGCGAKINWYPDYGQAQPVARRDNRPMLLYFWDWLSRDRARMEMQVFSDPRVVAAMRRTVNVRLEQGWFRDLTHQYDVRTVPTFVLTDPEGVEQARLTGVPTPGVFVDWLSAAMHQVAATQPAAPDQSPATRPLTSQPVSATPPTPATQPEVSESQVPASE